MKRIALVVGLLPLTVQSYAIADGARVLTLDEALHLARANYPQLRISRAQTEASRARVDVARAPLLPQLNATGSAQETTNNVIPRPGFASTDRLAASWNTNRSYSSSIVAKELLYDFGQTTRNWDAAKTSLRSQEENERNAAVQLGFNLRNMYYTTAAARALVKVAEENLRNQEAHLRQIQAFVEAGTRPEIDLAQARTDRANAQVQLINAQVAYDTDKALLNQAMGVEQGVDYDVAEATAEAIGGENETTDVLLAKAIKARPDLLSLARQVEAQELTTRSIKGGYAPSFGFATELDGGGTGPANLGWNWSAGLSLSWQIFGGGITKAQVRESQATTTALRAQYDLQRQQVRADVEQARLGVRSTKAAIEATHEATVNARVRLTLAEGRYQAGVGSIIELGDSQVALATAAAQEVQAIYNLAIARARLQQALGQP
jgi:outer membrane protein